jgi:hypothetical protein
MALIGSLEQYDPEKQDFKDYSERLEQFLIVNQVEAEMKVPMLITLIGPETYNVLRNLVSPDKPSTKKYDELLQALTQHYVVKKSAVAGRYEFYACRQIEGQSVNEFVVEIKKRAAFCNFGTFLNEALRDRLVCGLAREQLVKKLLTIGDSLSFDEAVKVAIAYESAEKEMKKMQPEMGVHLVHKQVGRAPLRREPERPREGKAQFTANRASRSECTRCGGPHSSEKCFKKSWTCYNCNRQGHIATKCYFRVKQVNEEQGVQYSANI